MAEFYLQGYGISPLGTYDVIRAYSPGDTVLEAFLLPWINIQLGD